MYQIEFRFFFLIFFWLIKMNIHVPGSNIHVQNVMCISNEQQSIYLVLMLILEITKSFLRENRSDIWPHSQPQISFFSIQQILNQNIKQKVYLLYISQKIMAFTVKFMHSFLNERLKPTFPKFAKITQNFTLNF